MQMSCSYSDSDSLRASWFLDRLRVAAPAFKSARCYTGSDQGESPLRMFLDSRSQSEPVLISILENDIACSDVEHTMRLHTGVGIYFDLNFAKMALERFAYSTSGQDGNSVFRKAYPDAPPIGDYQARSWPVASFTRAFPLGSPTLSEISLAFVFTHAQKRFLSQHYPELPLELLPLPLIPIEANTGFSEAQILRQILKFQEEDFVVGITADKNSLSGAEQLLQAIGQASLPCKLLWLTRDLNTEALAQRSLGKFGLESKSTVLRLGSTEEWSAFHSAFDLAADLHLDPLAGPTLSQLICMERGVPLLASSLGFGADLPESAALKLHPNRFFEELLVRQLAALAESKSLRDELKAGAREFAGSQGPEQTAAVLLKSLEQAYPSIHDAEQRRSERLQAAQAQLLEQSSMRRGEFGKVSPDRLRLSEVASSLGWNIPVKGQLRGV